MRNAFEIIDIHQLSPADMLLKAAKEALTDYRNLNGCFESTETAMTNLEEAIRRVELQPDSNGWIVWKGGPCPVAFETIVDISHADGQVETGVVAGHYLWGHIAASAGRDITAYRVVNGERLSAATPKPVETKEQIRNAAHTASLYDECLAQAKNDALEEAACINEDVAERVTTPYSANALIDAAAAIRSLQSERGQG